MSRHGHPTKGVTVIDTMTPPRTPAPVREPQSPPVHTTLQRFTDMANARGLERARVVRSQRRRTEAVPRDGGGDFYAPLLATLRRGLQAGGVERALAELLARSAPGRREHFAAVAEGFVQVVDRLQVVGAVPTQRGPWRHAELEVNVTGLFGVRLADGEQQAWVLHKKAAPLEERAADLPLSIVDAMLAARSSPLRVRVVDLRRAEVYGIDDDQQRAELRDLAQAEAEAYVSLWRAAAA